jgi:prolyl oligopeptidase
MKFAATLQSVASPDNTVILRIETSAGHGAGKPTAKIIEEQTDIYAFLYSVFGVSIEQ